MRRYFKPLFVVALACALPGWAFGQTVLNGGLESGNAAGVPDSWKMWPGSSATSEMSGAQTGRRCLKGMMTQVDQTILCGGSTMLSGINPSGGEFDSISVMVYIPSTSKDITFIALGIDQNRNRNLDSEELGFQPAPKERDKWVKVETKEPAKLKLGPNTGVIDVAVLGIGNTVGEILYFDELQVAAKGGEAGDDPERIRSPFEPPPRVATPVPTQARFGTLYPSGGKPRIGTHPPAIGANPSSKGAPSGGIDWMGPRGNNNAANSGRGNRGNQGKPWRMSWDWAVDFSAAQGQNNWHYREWDGKEYRDLTWSAAENAWLGVGRDTAKAGRKEVRIEQGKLKPEQNDAALTWVAGRPGTVAVTGAAKKFNTKTGDGVYVGILMNDKDVLWQKTLAFNDGQGAAHAINVSVQTGDTIVFRVNQRGNSSADMVEWNPKIAYVN